MKNGKCPKCSSGDIRVSSSKDWKLRSYRKYFQLGLLSYASLDEYVCANCGYIESYVTENEKDRSKITKLPGVKS